MKEFFQIGKIALIYRYSGTTLASSKSERFWWSNGK